jgi:N6-L-threonylcarbamoyladenine synthase
VKSANLQLADIDAVAVAHRPGLIGSLLIGVTAAKTLAWLLGKPLIGVDHVQAHLYSVTLDHPERNIEFPAAGAVLSGGHTALYELTSWQHISRLGGTIDDAIGEAYDKVAAILGLPFPGGPAVAKLADTGDPKAVAFPRSTFEADSLEMSLSGLKTAVLYRALGKQGKQRRADDLPEKEKADIAASFQAAVLDVLEIKLRRLIRQTARGKGARCLLLGGGVVSNRALRERLSRLGLPVHLPERHYCTDNAAMSAGLAHVLLQSGQVSPLDLDAITHSAITVAPTT